jgi:hypothetical protein
MQITTFDHEVPGKRCGIEIPLRRLAASPKPLESACWHKLLELVEHLQSSGPEPELRGQIIFGKLILSQPAPPDPGRNLEMKKFMDEWRASNPDSTTWANGLSRELRRRFPGKPRIQVSIRVDWRDYAPLRDGLPEMHHRFEVKRPGETITEDARTQDPVQAERIKCEAFGF